MKQLKVGLVAMLAAIATIAFVGAGSASATVMYKSVFGFDPKQDVGTTIEAKLTGPKLAIEDTAGNKWVECSGAELHLLIEYGGEKNSKILHPNGSAQKHTYTGCPVSVSTVNGGTWEVKHIPSTDNGLFIATSTEVKVWFPSLGVNCTFKTNATATGTLNGNEEIGGTTYLELNGPLSGASGDPCPTSARITATYEVTNIPGLYVWP
ncbi:MAG TPA: hypothetical protein VFM51_02560 [Solirubrobacterales bacterium]|nr:hypothetical protein [Solirubrobacterales bacterium]